MPFYDVWVVMLQDKVHLFYLLRGQGLNCVDVVLRSVKFGTSTSPGRGLHGQGSFGQGFQIGSIIDAETLA